MRRSLRIFPLYYAALAVTLLLLPAAIPSIAAAFRPAIDNQAWLWLYGAKLAEHPGRVGARTAQPLLVAGDRGAFLSGVAGGDLFHVAADGDAVVCRAICCVDLARAVWLASGGNNVAAEVLTPLRMDGLVLGSWLALAARGPGGLAWLVSWARPSLLLFGVFGSGCGCYGPPAVWLAYAAWA